MNTVSFKPMYLNDQIHLVPLVAHPSASAVNGVVAESSSAYTHLRSSMKVESVKVRKPCSSLIDLPKPKRPRTAYNLFFQEEQKRINAIRRFNPKASNSASTISINWKHLTTKEKAVYFQRATEDKIRYYKDKEIYEDYLERLKETVQQDESQVIVDELKPEHDILPQDWRVPNVVPISDVGVDSSEDNDPAYSSHAISLLASALDKQSIDFLVKALK